MELVRGRGVGVNGMAGIQPWHRVKGSEPCSEQLRSPGLREAKWFVCLFTWICGAVEGENHLAEILLLKQMVGD